MRAIERTVQFKRDCRRESQGRNRAILDASLAPVIEAQAEDTPSKVIKSVLLLKPRGFCAGVVCAIDIVELALQTYGPPVYVRKEIVRNRFVVHDLASRGAILVSEVEEVPAGERLLCSTHGIAPSVRRISAERQPKVFDTTCPLVTKVHMEVVRFSQLQATIALLGHCRHDELIGTIGEAPERTIVGSTRREAKTVEVPRSPVAYLTQTTHSLDEADVIIGVLRRQFPHVQAPPEQDICYATKNRQCATRRVEADADLLLVVRSENSSNLQRTVEVDRGRGLTAYLIDHEADIAPSWRSAASRIAVSAGHSAPEAPAQRVVRHQREAGFQEVQEQKLVEGTVHSPLPSELGATQQLTQIAVHP